MHRMHTDKKQAWSAPHRAGACPAQRGRTAEPPAFREGGMAAARSRACGHLTLPEPAPNARVGRDPSLSVCIGVHPWMIPSLPLPPAPKPWISLNPTAHRHLLLSCSSPSSWLKFFKNRISQDKGDERDTARAPVSTISLVSTQWSGSPAPRIISVSPPI